MSKRDLHRPSAPLADSLARPRTTAAKPVIIPREEFLQALDSLDVQETLARAREILDSGEFPPRDASSFRARRERR